jgi:hypothetical protein
VYELRVKHGTYLEEPTAFHRPGYVIESWHLKDGDNETIWNFEENKVRKDIKLHAKSYEV